MKSKITILSSALIAMAVTGCAALQQKPPTALETKFYDVVTNVVEKTNFTTVTNFQQVTVTVPVQVTNFTTHEITTTNVINVPVVQVFTNFVEQTNFVYAVNDKTKAEVSTVSTLATAVAGPYGALAGAVLSGILGIWGTLRSRQATTLGTVAANSTQVIETARNIIRSMPNGSQIGAQFDNWMMTHQQDAGIANEVASIVDAVVDPSHATHAASDILGAITAPIAPPATTPKAA